MVAAVLLVTGGALAEIGTDANDSTVSPNSAMRITDLGTLGGEFSQAFSINDRGQVVGVSLTESGEAHAALWSK